MTAGVGLPVGLLGRRKIEYTYTGEFDPWVPATREFFETMMPETLSKTEGIEEEIFAELDKGGYNTYQQVVDMLKDKFGIEATRQLAARLVGRWRKARSLTAWKSTFHERINELWQRAKDQNRKLTQDEYARRFGVTRNALMGWLRGSGQPDADGFVRIAEVEKVSLSWLMGDERPESDEGLLPEEERMLQLFRGISSEHQGDLVVLAKHFQAHDRQGAVE